MPSSLREAFKEGDALKKTLPESASSFLPVPGISSAMVHVVETSMSSDTHILFVHGSPGDFAAFAPYLTSSRLKDRFSLRAIDRPGFGKTLPGTPVMDLHRQALHLYPILKKNHGKNILVGHSYGAPVILRAAIDYPTWVDGVVIIAGSVDPGLEKWKWYNRLASQSWVEKGLPTDIVHSNRELATLKKELEILEQSLPSLRCPVWVVHGTKDRLVPYENVAFLKRQLPPSQLHIKTLPDEGHFILWSHVEAITDAIIEAVHASTSALKKHSR